MGEQREPRGDGEAAELSAAAVQQRLRALHAAVDTVNHQVAERLGVNRTDLQCLSLLSLHGAMTAGEVATAMRLPTGTVTTVLDRLEHSGLAARQRSASDRRKVLVSLSAEGGRRLGAAYRPLMARSARNIARYDDEQIAVIVDFLTTSVELTAAYVPPDEDGPH